MRKRHIITILFFALLGCRFTHQTPTEDTTPTPTPIPTPLPTSGTKRAVLIGINNYQSGQNALRGCVNDAKNIKTQAISSWGFQENNITMLLDSQATKANVVNALNKAVEATKKGDTLLYWHSSHGAEDAVSVDAAGEPDSMNQLVCCYDFAWDKEHELIDKEYVQIFSKLPNGVYFGWASDTCHSGDLSKEITKRQIRIKEMPQPDFVKARVARAKARGLIARSIVGGILDVGFLSGCTSDGLSADTEDDKGSPGGALTIYFIKIINNHPNNTLKDIASELRTSLRNDGYQQEPQAEGARADKPWLK